MNFSCAGADSFDCAAYRPFRKTLMTPEQYALLTSAPTPQAVIGVADLVDKTPRTLIYGYLVSRSTFHVYLGADGLIHVLTYDEGFAAEGSDVVPFLVQHHSAGPSGGVEGNSYYVPSKRVYPERSDFEFCQLLFRHGVSPCFTTYSNISAEKLADRPSAYAGRTFDEPGATIMVNVSSELTNHPAFKGMDYIDRRDLAGRVAYQTARDLRLALTSDSGTVCVPQESVEAFNAAAHAMASALPKHIPSADGGIADDLVEHLYGKGKLAGSFNVTTEATYGGELHFEVSLQDRQPIRARSKRFTAYSGGPDGHWPRGVSGVFEGRPFIACQSKQGDLNIRLSQFGGTERFLPQYLRMMGLGPVDAAAPQTAQA
jgi:hypothetical protein